MVHYSHVDIKMCPHHDVLMRTTIDLPEDLHRIAMAIARDSASTLSQTVADLIRKGLRSGVADGRAPYQVNASTGLPVVQSKRTLTAEDVRRLEEDA